MTPQEYLAELQSPYVFYPYLLNIRSKLASAFSNEAPEIANLDEILRQFETQASWVARNHQDILSKLPKEIVDKLPPDRVVAGELKSAGINASAIRVPGMAEAYVITLQTGLSHMLYKCARVIAATLPINDAPAAVSDVSARELVHTYLSYYSELGATFGDDFQCSAAHIVVASQVASYAERFVHCHELSHVLLGHLSEKSTPIDGWMPLEEALPSVQEEIDADVYGLKLLCLTCESASDLEFAFTGASLFLEISGAIERHDANCTHPPSGQRLSAVNATYDVVCKRFGITRGQAAPLSHSFLRRARDVLVEVLRTPLSSPYRALLERCSRGYIPDYRAYYMELFPILAAGAPARVCRTLGQVWAEAEAALASVPSDEGNGQRRRQLSNELKLSAGFVYAYAFRELRQRIERARCVAAATIGDSP